jgi:hypothetical protein
MAHPVTMACMKKGPQRRPAQRAVLILACTLAGAAWLIYRGPMPVLRITTPLPVMAPTWYMLLAFPVLGMLVADLIDLWRSRGIDRSTAELGFMIALIIALSRLRLGARIPVSGHALLTAYFIARRLLLRTLPPRQSPWELAAAVAALGAIAYPQLVWWNDPVTLLAGLTAGALLGGVSWLVRPYCSNFKTSGAGT